MSQTNLNTIRWVTDKKFLFEKKWYAYSEVFKLICPVGRFIPFQLPKTLDNRDITSFKLISRETGTEYDVFSDMETMGLYVDRSAYENYSSDSISNQQSIVPTAPTSWGFSIGAPRKFRYVKTKIFARTSSYGYHLVVKDSSDGNIIGQAGGTINGLTVDAENDVDITMLDMVKNPDGKNLWFELRMSAEFWFVGRDDIVAQAPPDYPNEEDKYGTGGIIDDYQEATIDATGGVGLYSGWVQVYGDSENSLIVFPAFGSFTQTIPPGLYDAEMSDGSTTWYSEPITMVEDVSCLPKITFFHRRNLDVGTHERKYLNGYRDWFYAYSQGPVKPNYPFFRKSDDRLGLPIKIYTATWKEYRIVFPAPEWLADSLRMLPLMDDVLIDIEGLSLDVDDIRFNLEWSDQGHLALIELVIIADRRIAQSNTTANRISTYDEFAAWSTDGETVYATPDDEVMETEQTIDNNNT